MLGEQARHQGVDGVEVGQVAGVRRRPPAVGGEVTAYALELVGAPGHQQHGRAARGCRASRRLADARRRAGDQHGATRQRARCAGAQQPVQARGALGPQHHAVPATSGQGRASSSWADRLSSSSSPSVGPTSWTPTGSPSSAMPAGTGAAGLPATFHSAA